MGSGGEVGVHSVPAVMRGKSRTGGPIFLITLEEGHGGARRTG